MAGCPERDQPGTLLVHPDTGPVRDLITSLIASSKRRFQQESVPWETTAVCAAF
jgi:hypothetical protein